VNERSRAEAVSRAGEALAVAVERINRDRDAKAIQAVPAAA